MVLKHSFQEKLIEAGCDEAGRGPLAGPVVGAAVILPNDFYHPDLNDSKKLTEKKLQLLRPIIEQEAIAYGVGVVQPSEIDEINILQATFLAIHKALAMLSPQPEFVIMDGNKFKQYKEIPFETIIKGDAKFMNIAAASVLAKTYRDEMMIQLHNEFPQYGWNKNKGYPTKAHRAAIASYGSCKYHRQSFRLLPTVSDKPSK